jgi:hypothetical protein
MFIRWQSRKRGSPAFGYMGRPDVHWAAILVEAYRTDGKPAQRHVAYLGGITESAIEHCAQRCYFWNGVTETLNRLGNRIPPDERLRIESRLAGRVPLPTPADFRTTVDNLVALWEGFPDKQEQVLKNTCRAALERWPA